MNYMHSSSLIPLLATIAALLVGIPAQAKNISVIVDATADESYVEQVKSRPYQTYHFIEGHRFGGAKADASLDRVSFMDVAESVAESLRRNRYFPSAHKDGGDLLIMISWGTTIVEPDWDELTGVVDYGNDDVQDQTFEGETDEALEVNADPIALQYDQITAGDAATGNYSEGLSTRLLGLNKGLRKSVHPWDREKVRNLLEEERYFIVLNAFDLPHMRATGELKQVWTSRYSTRNIGTGFDIALAALNQAAAPTFGRNLPDLESSRVDTNVYAEIGELEVIGYEDSQKADSRKKN